MTYRDLILAIVPPWLKRSNGAKLLYTFGLHIDILVEMVRVAVLHRFPGGTLYEKSLAILGRDRKIIRGLYETANSYRARLRSWISTHKRRGSPVELLNQVQAHYAPNPTPLILTSYLGRTYTMAADGSYVISQGVSPPDYITAQGVDYWGDPGYWGDGGYWGEGSSQWARLWLEFDRTGEEIGEDGTWGSGSAVWGDGGIWGRDLDPAEVIDYRVVPSEWKAAHINPFWIVLRNDGDPVYIEVN